MKRIIFLAGLLMALHAAFGQVTVSGTFYHSNIPNTTITNPTIWANLVNTTTGKVVAVTTTSGNNGAWSFSSVAAGTYKVQLTKYQGEVGKDPPESALEDLNNFCDRPYYNSGLADGYTSVFTVTNQDITGLFVAYDTQWGCGPPNTPPTAIDITKNVSGAPAIGILVSLADQPLSGYDNEDTGGITQSWSGYSIRIVTQPTNGFVLVYNGEVLLGNNFDLYTYDATKLSIRPTASTPAGTLTTTFTYYIVDGSGENSAPANYTVNYTSTTPVNFGNISASLHNGLLSVRFVAEKEINNSHFDIEVSQDGMVFNKIGRINSKANGGNSDQALVYSFEIGTPLAMGFAGLSLFAIAFMAIVAGRRKKWLHIATLLLGISLLGIASCAKKDSVGATNTGKIYLRIAQVDIDGTVHYSRIVQVVNE